MFCLWTGVLTANYGVYLWGPTLVSLLLGYDASRVGYVFSLVAAAGIAGKVAFSFLPMLIGRRHSNTLGCAGVAVVLALLSQTYASYVFELPCLVILLVLGTLFFDGVISNIAPFTVEIYPTGLAARGYGFGQASDGVGKIAGPPMLAVIAGTGNFVSPKATVDAAAPAFLFLAGCALVAALASVAIPIDPLQDR